MKKHQINLVGSAILPTYYAIKKFGPDEVHLVVTTESRVIVEPLLKLVQQAHKHLLQCYKQNLKLQL